jgi:glycosyltransferase involved in cell wall biosynthesis
MSDRLQVSVVIPVYARQVDAEAALRSALAQSDVAFEIIVVDDGSPTAFRLPEDLAGDPRIRLVRLDRNAGAAAARNRGIREARAPWLAFLDSDDLWLPGKLARQLGQVAAVGAQDTALVGFVTGFRQIELASGASLVRIPVASMDPADFAAGCWFGPGSTALLPRAAFERIGPIDETLERLEDLDWFLRFALAGGGIQVLEAVEVDVRVGGRPSREKLDRAVAVLRRKWLAADSPTRLPPALRRNLAAYLLVEQASTRYFAGDPVGCCVALLRSWLLRPRLRLHLKRWWRDSIAGAEENRSGAQ